MAAPVLSNNNLVTKTAMRVLKGAVLEQQTSFAAVTVAHASGSPVIDATAGNYFEYTCTGTATITCTGCTAPGQPITLAVIATGGTYTLTFSTGIDYVSSTISLTQDKYFLLTYMSNGTRIRECSRTTAITPA